MCACIQLVAPGREKTSKEESKLLDNAMKHMKDSKDMALRYVPLLIKTEMLHVITESSFSNAQVHKSQLWFALLLSGDRGNPHIFHYASSRCRLVTRSAMDSVFHSLTRGFYHTFVIQDLVFDITGRKHPIEAFKVFKMVFDVVPKLGQTTEKRLKIDFTAVMESYRKVNCLV